MPLIAPEMKARFQNTIKAGLQRVYSSDVSQGQGYTPEAQAEWAKLADAISDIAMDIVTELTTNAEVLPGQAVVTAGSPVAQAGTTVSPGKIL
jgi:hypothetical protein